MFCGSASSKTMGYKRGGEFKRGRTSIQDGSSAGRPISAQDTVLENHAVTQKELMQTEGIIK